MLILSVLCVLEVSLQKGAAAVEQGGLLPLGWAVKEKMRNSNRSQGTDLPNQLACQVEEGLFVVVIALCGYLVVL